MSKCAVSIEGIDNQVDTDISNFKDNTIAAVASMIGYPSKIGIKNALARVKSATTPRELKIAKKQLKAEESKYDDHRELFDTLASQIFSAGEAVQFDMNPMDPIDAWKVYFSKRQLGIIDPVSALRSPYTMKTMLNRVNQIDKKRDRLMKSGKLSNREIAAFPPEVIAITADKFGVMMKVIRKGLRLSDNEISSYEGYANKIRTSLEKFKNNLTDNPAITKLMNLNDASAWGIQGFITRVDAPPAGEEAMREGLLTGPGERVLIMGEGTHNGVLSYKVKYYNDDNTLNDQIWWLAQDHLNASRSEVKKAQVGFYVGEFLNEVLDGRTRYVTLGTVPPKVFEEGQLVETTESFEYDEKYGKRVSHILEEMKEDYEYGQDKDDRRTTPNVHFVRGKDGTQYKYVLLKDTDEFGKETYNAILISNEPYKNTDPTKRRNFVDDGYDAAEWDNINMDEGWYRSQEEKYYGRMRSSRDGEMIDGSSRKAWHNFSALDTQPPSEIFESITKGEATTELGYNTFWDSITEMRNIYKAVGDKVQEFNNTNNEKSLSIREKISDRMKKMGLGQADMDKVLEKLFGIGGMRSRVWYSPEVRNEAGELISEGSINTPNTYFSPKRDNYFPHIFKKRDLYTMIDNAVDRLEENMAEIDTKSDKYASFEEGLKHLQDMRSRLTGDVSDDDVNAISRMVESQTNPHLKHITSWTDATYMRTDSDVHSEYLKKIFSALHRNDLMADTVEAVDKLMQMEKNVVPEGSIDYLVNRIKMSVGDSDTRSIGLLTGKESGYAQLANNLNGMPSAVRGGVNFTAQSSEKFVKWINSFPSMRFLGSGSASHNLTQIMNQIIANGFGTFKEAMNVLGGDFTKQKWQSIVNGTGVLNILSMFNDIMLQGGDVEWNDMALFPGTALPTRNMVDFVRLLVKGRDNFILNGDKDIDKFLMNLEARSRGISRENVRELRDLNKQRKEILARKRGEYFDAFAVEEKDNKDAIVMRRFKQLIGEVSDQKIRQMVTWKLSWHFDSFKKGFTFTGTEQYLRSITAVMALLDAEKRGQLGGDIDVHGSNGDLSIFKTDRARKIARDAVYNTQFGMTPQYVGEGFNGLGRAIYQYKTYATQQVEHDWSVLQNFIKGGNGTTRMISAIGGAIDRLAKGKSYNPADQTLDHEAIAASRLVFSRILSSILASAVSVMPPVSWMLRKFGHQSFSLLRSFENPAMGVAMRLAAWSALIMMGAEDENKDKALSELIDDFSFIFIPVFIGMVGRDVFDVADWLD